MSSEEVNNRLIEIIKDVFDDYSIVVNSETNAADIEDWDSLTHISLLVAIEKEFKIKFNLTEVKPLKNVGEMLELIIKKIM
jgi:acyl carrier protein